MSNYEGPIEVGMRFLWEPMKPTATVHLKVIERMINSDDEMWITTRAWLPTTKVSGDYDGETAWIDEGRFREAVVLVVDMPDEDQRLVDLFTQAAKALNALNNELHSRS